MDWLANKFGNSLVNCKIKLKNDASNYLSNEKGTWWLS